MPEPLVAPSATVPQAVASAPQMPSMASTPSTMALASSESAVATTPATAPMRATSEVFRLTPVSTPRPDFDSIAAPTRSVPVPHGTVFAGLGTHADRRRYVAALLHGGVFGLPEAAPGEAVASEPAVEEFSWQSVSVAAVASPVDLSPPPAALAGETELEGEGEALESAVPSPRDAIQPTATLGELYLSQGHRQEARSIFEKVLATQPDNPAARDGLASARREDVQQGRAGVTARKVAVLQDFLKRVRGGSEQHVS
jgi:hypothetical protein